MIDLYLLQPELVTRWPMQIHKCVVRVLAVTVCSYRFVCKHSLITASCENVLVVHNNWQCVTNCGLNVSLVVCRVLAGMGGMRHTAKFILPLRAKNPSSLPLMLLAGHCLSQVTCSAMLSAFHTCFYSNLSQAVHFLAVVRLPCCPALTHDCRSELNKPESSNRTVFFHLFFLRSVL
jgi:hypothetical protein